MTEIPFQQGERLILELVLWLLQACHVTQIPVFTHPHTHARMHTRIHKYVHVHTCREKQINRSLLELLKISHLNYLFLRSLSVTNCGTLATDCVFWAGDQIQDLLHARQACYHEAASPDWQIRPSPRDGVILGSCCCYPTTLRSQARQLSFNSFSDAK